MMAFVIVVLLQFQIIFTLKVDDEIHIGVRATIWIWLVLTILFSIMDINLIVFHYML